MHFLFSGYASVQILANIYPWNFGVFLSKRVQGQALRVGPGKICLTWPWGGSLLLTWQTRQRNLQITDEWEFFLGYWVTFFSSTQYMSHLFQDRLVAAQMWRF